MNHDGKQFKSLQIALKGLEPFIRGGKHLETSRPFKAMHGKRSRESLVSAVATRWRFLTKKKPL
jgi:hypothetical protein